MKTNKLFLLIAALSGAFSFISCHSNDDTCDNDSPAVKFSSGVTAPITKVTIDNDGNSTWETGDPIGIYMVETGTTVVSEGAANIKYTAALPAASTTFNAASAIIYYPVDELTKVDFIAYHPHNTTVADYSYPINLQSQISQTGIDLMWAKADNLATGYDKTNNSAVNFEFGHQLVKLVMNISKSAGVTGDISSVSIKGMNTTANFDLKGTAGITGEGDSQAITPYSAIAGSRYEAILLPVGTIGAAHVVEFTIGTDVYTWPMANDMTSLESGSLYTYDITLTKHAVDVTGSIKKWTTVAPGTGIAE